MEHTVHDFRIEISSEIHVSFAKQITEEMELSAKVRGTGIAKRSTEYIENKIREGKAIIAIKKDDGAWAGFSYIETWSHDKYVANSGLIVSPAFRKAGLARAIKKRIFELSRSKYPDAKIFGLTTGLTVMKINSELGYEPVTYSELTDDNEFWKGCQSCVNYEILMSKERKNCLCTGMLYDPVEKAKNQQQPENTAENFKKKSKLYERWMRIKNNVLLKAFDRSRKAMISVFQSLTHI